MTNHVSAQGHRCPSSSPAFYWPSLSPLSRTLYAALPLLNEAYMQSNTLFDLWIRFHFDTKFTFMTDSFDCQYWVSACFPLQHDCMSKNIHIKSTPSQADIPLHPMRFLHFIFLSALKALSLSLPSLTVLPAFSPSFSSAAICSLFLPTYLIPLRPAFLLLFETPLMPTVWKYVRSNRQIK